MKFLSYDLTRKLLENGKPENRDQDHPPVVKLFLPNTPCTWLLSEIDYQEPTIAFGLCVYSLKVGVLFSENGERYTRVFLWFLRGFNPSLNKISRNGIV